MESDKREICIFLQTTVPQGSRLLAVGALLAGCGLIASCIHMNTLGYVGIGLHGVLLVLTAAQRYHPLSLLWYSFRLFFAVTIAVLAVVCVLLETANIKITVSSMTLDLLLLVVVLYDMIKICGILEKSKKPTEPQVTFQGI